MGRSLWREYGSVVYNCCWASPAQSFSGPSPVELATIFYCLRFETSPFCTSFDSQGYSGVIRLRLHTGFLSSSKSESKLHWTDGQLISKSWYRAPSGAHNHIFITLWQLWSCFCGAPSLMRGRVCLLYMLLALASVVFHGSKSLGTRDHILLSQIWDFALVSVGRVALYSRGTDFDNTEKSLFYYCVRNITHRTSHVTPSPYCWNVTSLRVRGSVFSEP
jgi:hypothetical protein